MAVNQKAIKVLNKIFEAGFTDEKAISAMTMDDILSIQGITIADIGLINDLQKSIKANKVISFLGGGIFYSMNQKQDDAPVINTERVVIVDSVINTGKSIMRIIDELKNHNPGIDVIIAANVIQNEAVELFKDYLVFATRLSKNSFVGVNQSKQTGKTGPDTADRLFNLIKKRY